MGKLIKPLQFEMQSQPGRYCDEKYRTLKLQGQETAPGSRVETPSLPSFYAKIEKRQRPTILEQLIAAARRPLEHSGSVPSLKHQTEQKTSSFAAQSRADYYQAMGTKDRVPSTGYYMPKYDSVFRSPRVSAMLPIHVTKGRKTIASSLSEKERPSDEHRGGEIPEVKEPFELQQDRPGITTTTPDVNEKRFEPVIIPNISTKMKRVSSVNMSKTLDRPNYVQPQTHPKYDPNYNIIWRKDVPNLNFSKLSSRTGFQPPESIHLSYRNIRFSQTAPRSQNGNFSALTSRPDSEAFPAHMVKVNSRMSLTVLQERSLAMSAYPTKRGLPTERKQYSETARKFNETRTSDAKGRKSSKLRRWTLSTERRSAN